MKIIKVGDLKRLDTAHRFECEHCGCIWEADRTEYLVQTDYRNGHYYMMQCPTCRRDAVCYPEDEKHEQR